MYSESCPRSKTTMLCPAARNKAELNSPQLAACKTLAKRRVGQDEQAAERRPIYAVDALGSLYEVPPTPAQRRAAHGRETMRP